MRAVRVDSEAWSRSLLDDAAPANGCEPECRCDVCGRPIQGEPAAHGLLIWTRGDEVRYELPPVCALCAQPLTVAGMRMSEDEGEQG
jgi:hypothetical protein